MISRPIQISSSVGVVQTILGFPSLIIGHEFRAWRIPVQASTLGEFHWRDLASPGYPRLPTAISGHLRCNPTHCGSKAPARSGCDIEQIAHASCRRGVSEKSRPIGVAPDGSGCRMRALIQGVRCCLLNDITTKSLHECVSQRAIVRWLYAQARTAASAPVALGPDKACASRRARR